MVALVGAAPPAVRSLERPLVVALVGPTATGKTALSLALAELLPVEVVSADSRMVYRWMDIGTAKPSEDERRRVPHHLVDVADPDEQYTLAIYQQHALAAIDRIHQRGRLPRLVGGTGLYVRAVCDGLQIPAVPPDAAYRAELEARVARDGWEPLRDALEAVDPVSAERIEPRNVRRVIRALEVHRATGVPFSVWQRRAPVSFETRFVGLDLERDALYERIDARVDEQIAAGLIDEVSRLVERGYDSRHPSMTGFGYRELAAHLRGNLSRALAIDQYKQATRHYARRQLTWFRPDERITWLDARTATAEDVMRVAGLPA
ncbi:MAG TPA: tRNA (adenosine(37)-N6)-dimethylallyltransferase MiaA [Chloroflexota bacterium]|nr:tRNA (adenosine(37)-N6)-dimethylallyltransferase MiaA [Chloroflexota bacterium]